MARLSMRKWVVGCVLVSAAFPAFASGGGHEDASAFVALALAIILVSAKIGGDVATRVGQPAVLGELMVGMLLGNVGLPIAEQIKNDEYVGLLASIGVLILLFEVGLESTIAQMLKVGLSSFLVAVLGVVVPFALGWGVGKWLLPDHSEYVHAFLGATLTATSVGITARVLKDLGRSTTKEARVILGAAVIDDVLGLLILAVVTGIIGAADRGAEMSFGDVGLTLLKATVFLVGSLVLGVFLSPKLFNLASRLKAHGVLLAMGLGVCFVLAWLAGYIGLAPIVGAFAAGLILDQVHYRDLSDREDHTLEELIHPISSFLVPVFFVVMGMRTDLRSFLDPGVFGLAAALTFVAILGKQACAFGVVGKDIDRLTVGLGMIPRGEVGLIFANIGMSMKIGGEHIMEASTYSAVVVMVVVTTMVTPPALKWSLARLPASPDSGG